MFCDNHVLLLCQASFPHLKLNTPIESSGGKKAMRERNKTEKLLFIIYKLKGQLFKTTF